MNPNDPNVQLVETVAGALGDLKKRVVFVGGCAVGLLITDEARPAVRATEDVDLVVEIATTAEYHQFGDDLRALGFREAPDEVICRWRLGALKVDVMPPTTEALGFSNRWYGKAIADAHAVTLPSGREIRLITAPVFVATKLEAFNDRGNEDYWMSHDMEDIVNLVDGRAELVGEVGAADQELRDYLSMEIIDLFSDTNFAQALTYHLGPTSEEQARSTIVIERLRHIAGL